MKDCLLFPKIGNKAKMSVLTPLIHHTTIRHSHWDRARKIFKNTQIENQEIKLFADDVIVHIENPKESTKKKKNPPRTNN